MKKLIIDRFENIYAICELENKTMIEIIKSELPTNCKEGDVIIFDNGTYSIDLAETLERKKRIKKKLNDLFN